jgi:hypothetical protein
MLSVCRHRDPVGVRAGSSSQTGTWMTRLARLRQYAAERVRDTRLSTLGRHVGLTPARLRNFLDGQSRRRHSVYSEQPRHEDGEPDPDVVIGALVRDLAPHLRAAASEQLVCALYDSYAQVGSVPPPWLIRLLAQMSSRGACNR